MQEFQRVIARSVIASKVESDGCKALRESQGYVYKCIKKVMRLNSQFKEVREFRW